VFRGWFGEAAGDKYAHEYFTKVIGNLAVNKLFEGKFADCWRAVVAIYQRRRFAFRSTMLLAHMWVKALGRHFVPGKFIQRCRVSEHDMEPLDSRVTRGADVTSSSRE
jgi:hypothetical protein